METFPQESTYPNEHTDGFGDQTPRSEQRAGRERDSDKLMRLPCPRRRRRHAHTDHTYQVLDNSSPPSKVTAADIIHCVKAELAGVRYRIHYTAKTNGIPTFAKTQSTRGYALIA